MSSAIERAKGRIEGQLKVAIVGSGPAGFYAVEALQKLGLDCEINVIERLPVPYGLVRYGVAPDHPKLKQTEVVFDKLARASNVRYFGNVSVGSDISLTALREMHHAVILAYGADADRLLGVPGETLLGSHAATEFVGWYNGHPDYKHRKFDFSHEVAVVIGQGNVAMDVARVLLKPVDDLRKTDIADHALHALSASRVRKVLVVGRRGPAQAKFTNKELKELGTLPDCGVHVSTDHLNLGSACIAELADIRNEAARKNIEVFRDWSGGANTSKRRLSFEFLLRPVEFEGQGRLESVTFERCQLHGAPFAQTASGTGERLKLSCGLVLRSIGYRVQALDGLAVDAASGAIANVEGRVLNESGLYVAGWAKRGPSGIIGTNKADAQATVQSLMADVSSFKNGSPAGAKGLIDHLAVRGVRWVSFDDWLKIDAVERARGANLNKPRQKLTSVADMLATID